MAFNFNAQFDYQQIAKIGDVVSQALDQHKQEAQEAQALRKLAAIYDPDGKANYQAMGLGELRGALKGYAVKQAMQEAQQKMQADSADRALKERQVRIAEALGQRQESEAATEKAFGTEWAKQAKLSGMTSALLGVEAPGPDPMAIAGKTGYDPFKASQLQENLARAMELQRVKQEAEFQPTGMVVNAGGYQIPGVKTSKGQFQPAMELATDASGKTNPRYSRELAGLTARDRLIGAQKTIDRISRIPETRRNAEDKLDLEEARNIVRELQSGGGGASAPGGSDDLWQQFLNGKK